MGFGKLKTAGPTASAVVNRASDFVPWKCLTVEWADAGRSSGSAGSGDAAEDVNAWDVIEWIGASVKKDRKSSSSSAKMPATESSSLKASNVEKSDGRQRAKRNV